MTGIGQMAHDLKWEIIRGAVFEQFKVDLNDVVANRSQVYREVAEELGFTFDLRWKADMRAIKMWQAAHPGNDLVWPDHADMVVWLLGEVDRLLKEIGIIERVLGQGPLT